MFLQIYYSIIGGVMEKLAIDFRLMATSRFEEVCESRRKEQKRFFGYTT